MDRDLTKAEFDRYHDHIYRLAGIHYPAEKLALLSNRIRRRLHASHVANYDAYLLRIEQDPRELQEFLDSVTTNETYFFRCQRHWDHFREALEQRKANPQRRREPLRIWSAAASTGAEAGTILIVLHQVLGKGFGGVPVEVLGTDLSSHALEEARLGTYRPYAVAQTPAAIQQQFFTRNDKDEFVFDRTLLAHVQFRLHNLMQPLQGTRPFDFVFLRNVMIYFDAKSRERVLANAFAVMQPGGTLIVGESESLLGIKHGFQYLKPSIFLRPAAATQPAPAARPGRTG